jgi:hypothetical protein
MTGAEIAQILLAAGTFVTAVGGVLIGMLNTRRIKEVHALTNSKMGELVEEVRTGAQAKGVQEGRDIEAAHQREPPKP